MLLQSLIQFLLQSIYNFVNSEYFGVLFLIWVVTDVFWIRRWVSLFQRIGQLFIKPWVFSKDTKPYEPPLYPRVIMEQLAQNKSADSESGSGMRKWIYAQRDLIFSSTHPFAAIGFVAMFIFFILFLVADAISVAQTLVVLGVGLGDLPPLFDRFDLAILGGALVSAIVGVWVYADLLGDNKPLFNTTPMHPDQRRFWKIIALFLFLSAFVVMASFAISRLIAIGKLPSTPTLLIILDTILYGLVPINNTLGAAICFLAVPQGFTTLVILLGSILLAVFPLIMFFVDVISRILYIFLDIAIWFLFTPFMVIPVLFSKLREMVSPPPAEPSPSPESKQKRNG